MRVARAPKVSDPFWVPPASAGPLFDLISEDSEGGSDGGAVANGGYGTGPQVEPAHTTVVDDPWESIRGWLAGHHGVKLNIHRTFPTYASGHLGSLHLAPGESIDPDMMLAEFGGGRYRIRAIDHGGKFLPGSAQLQLAGAPRINGQVVGRDGIPIEHQPAQLPMRYGGGAVPRHNPHDPIADSLVQHLREQNAELMRRVESLENRLVEQRGEPPSHPLAGLDEMVGALKKLDNLRTVVAGTEPLPDADGGGGGMGFGNMSMPEMMMMMMGMQMMGNQQQPGVPPNPMQQQFAGMMAQRMGMPMPPMPPGQQPGMPGIMPGMPGAYPQQPGPWGPQPPPQWAYPQQPPHGPPPAAAAPAPPQAPPAAPPQPETIAPSQLRPEPEPQPAAPVNLPPHLRMALDQMPPEQVAAMYESLGDYAESRGAIQSDPFQDDAPAPGSDPYAM